MRVNEEGEWEEHSHARTHTHTCSHQHIHRQHTHATNMQNAQQGLKEGSCSVLQTVGDEAETSGCPVEVDRFVDTYRNSKAIIVLLIVLLLLPFIGFFTS